MLTVAEIEEIEQSIEGIALENLNMPDDDGWLLIHSAAYYGNIKLLKFALENAKELAVDVAIPGTQMTCLLLAATSGCYDSVKTLLEHGADINAVDHMNRTALHLTNSGKIAELLLEKNINKNIRDKGNVFSGETALDTAKREGKLAVISAISGG